MNNRFLKTITAVFISASLLSSCASNFSLTKRRYSSGYQVQLNLFGNNHKTAVAQNPKSAKPEIPLRLSTMKPVQQKVEWSTPNPAKTVVTSWNKPQETGGFSPVGTMTRSKTLNSKNTAVQFRHAAAFASAKMVQRSNNSAWNEDDNTLLYLIVAFFLPFLGVLLYEREITNHFWISLLLTILFWLPGFIYAILVILGEI